jgi:ribosomal 50S subunit-recycling heat shock protein
VVEGGAMSVAYVEQQHPRGPHGEWIKKSLSSIKGKAAPKSFKFYKQGYKPKPMHTLQGTHVKHYGSALYKAKQEGHFSTDYEFWLAAQKLHADAKKKHGANAPKPHAIVNAAFNHELTDTGGVNMLGSAGGVPKATKNVHDVTPGGIKTVSKFLAPGQLQPTGKKMPGVNGAMVYKDAKGGQWLVKFPGGSKGTSQAYSNSLFLVDLDVATSRIQNKAGLPVPSIHAKEVDGKVASVHKMYSRVSDAFPTNNPKLSLMDDKDIVEIQKNMVLDWLLSNHDPHSGNFLKTDKGIIGIDKGQSFKYFGKDKLSTNYGSDINPPLAPNVPVYSTLMKQAQEGKGDMDFNNPEVQKTISRIQAIPDDEYKGMLRPYAEKAAKVGLLNYPGKQWGEKPDVEKFLEAAVARKNNLATDFENLNNEIHPKPASLEELSPEGMGVKKAKIPGELAKDMKSVEVGDWITLQGDTNKVVALHKDYVTLDDGAMIPPNSFENGHVQWAAAPKPKGATGYTVVAHPTETGKFTIKKPNGEFSKSSGGEVKSWATEDLALGSSTMAKYKAQGDTAQKAAEQQAKAQMAGAQAFAQSAPDIKPGDELDLTNSNKYKNLKTKIAAGEAFTPEEYVQLKSYVQQIKEQNKASGAAQVEHDFEPSGFEIPVKPAKKTKGGFKEKPKFKISGGAPPAIEKATGPNAVEDGKMLWEMKKAGKIQDDYKMWSEAKKASGKAKKAALLQNPNAQSGIHYSSANQIRNVAMRLEFDETGDVTWETAEEKTSETIGQTVGQIKKTTALHSHKPVVNASASHHVAGHVKSHFPEHWDVNAVVGSYTNPHAFKYGDTQAIHGYGYKYTSHNSWPSNQRQAWYSFSGSGSGTMNTFFRTGDVGMFGNVESIKKQCKDLVDAFKSDNIKPLDDWTQVVRGTSGGWELGIGSDSVSFEQMQGMVGKVVRNKCPVSTSLRDRPPWGSYRITYKLPPGFRGLGLYGKSAHSPENEMMLPPGMAYRILDVKKGSGSGYQNEVLVEVVDVKLPEIT